VLEEEEKPPVVVLSALRGKFNVETAYYFRGTDCWETPWA